MSESTNEGGPRFQAVLGDHSLFPALEARYYLNHGGISAPSLAIRHALNQGVHSVHLVSGVTADALLVECFTNEGAGTMIVKDGE